MKTLKILLIALVFGACNQSINKDLVTGATSRGDGLSCDDISIQINKESVKRNTFTFGETVVFSFNHIKGFKEENGKVYPEMSMVVIKKENQMVLSNLNLLNLKDGTNLSPLKLEANFSANFPYQNNEEYEVQITIWDTKGEGKFTYNMPFTIKGNEHIKAETTDITYKSIFLWNENKSKMVLNNRLNSKEKYALVIEGVSGLKIENGKVHPELSLLLTDAKGNILIANKNLYNNLPNGLDVSKLTEGQIPVILTFNGDEFFNPYHLNVVLKDTKSDKKLIIETDLEIE